MKFYEMTVFCLRSYLEQYKTIVCEGKFQQGTNIMEIIESIIFVLESLAFFAIRTQGYRIGTQGFWARTFDLEVPDMRKYKGVCENNLRIICYYDDIIVIFYVGDKGVDNVIIEGARRETSSRTRKATHCCFLHPCVPGKGI